MTNSVPYTTPKDVAAFNEGVKETQRKLRADCRNAFRAIAEALAEPSGGSYHHARKILDAHDIYHDDLEGLRVLRVLAELMLSKLGGRVTHGTTRKVGK